MTDDASLSTQQSKAVTLEIWRVRGLVDVACTRAFPLFVPTQRRRVAHHSHLTPHIPTTTPHTLAHALSQPPPTARQPPPPPPHHPRPNKRVRVRVPATSTLPPPFTPSYTAPRAHISERAPISLAPHVAINTEAHHAHRRPCTSTTPPPPPPPCECLRLGCLPPPRYPFWDLLFPGTD